ncbi:choline/carnitine/betaine transport [Scopulibacillus darangshiensis]|uniref:Choline/carnitine/betaine transport n=1 Tax=Scopulibacillus darangshiensis TaxID=442528 RepID=A0A4R2P1R4_9BACL|nr:BCCT family transporter [Scopulibacillus darangshiensis]TCP27811.1 choline/carnitine/betaine transport [Scopulibacillus darangshiensis]
MKGKTGIKTVDWPTFLISGGFLLLFLILALTNIQFVSRLVNSAFSFSVNYFGAFWQVLMLLIFFIALFIAFSKYGNIRLGNKNKPEMSTFKWLSIILCTLLAGGGVFWAAAEPMYHFVHVPPMFSSVKSGTVHAIAPALTESFLHWGFLAWAVLGTLSSIVLMYSHYHKNQPLKPRTLLYPFFGESIQKNWLGTLVDAVSVIAVAAGTIGPIGFLGLQVAYGMNALFGIPDNFATQAVIIIGVVLVSCISAVTGINKGIQLLSRLNVVLTVVLLAAVLLLGPGKFIINSFVASFGTYLQDFMMVSTYRGDNQWLGLWTVFFWGWFMGYGPMMAVFISRISRGRTIREIVLAVAIIAPILTNFWFTVVGGSGIFYELKNPGSISQPLTHGGMPAAMIAITNQLPLPLIMGFGFLLVTILFVATTTDSMAFTISMAVTGLSEPQAILKAFWALIMGAIALVLIVIGDGGVNALQSFIVVTAVPVSLLLLTTLWSAPKVVKEIGQLQKKQSDYSDIIPSSKTFESYTD